MQNPYLSDRRSQISSSKFTSKRGILVGSPVALNSFFVQSHTMLLILNKLFFISETILSSLFGQANYKSPKINTVCFSVKDPRNSLFDEHLPQELLSFRFQRHILHQRLETRLSFQVRLGHQIIHRKTDRKENL